MAYPDAILALSPVFLLQLDEASGTVADDASPNNNDGTYSGVLLNQTSAHQHGSSVEFSSGDTVFLGTSPTVSASWSVSFWLRHPATDTNYHTIIAKRDSWSASGTKFAVWIHKNGTQLEIGNGSSVLAFSTWNPPEDNVWRHIVVVNDTGAGQRRLYVDKVLTQETAGALSDTGGATAGVSIGKNHYDATFPDPFVGGLDDVALFNSVLTQTDVDAIYDEATTAGGTAVTPNDTSQSQTSETPALTQIHAVTANDTAQSQATETPSLTQVHSLTANDTGQSQSTETPALTQIHAVSPSETSQSQASDTPTLTQVHDLSPQETSQAQTSENPTISVEGTLSPESTSQSQSTETPAITQVHGLSPTDTSQSQASETPDLSQVHGLSPNETSQSQASENPSINVFAGLTPLDTSQSQTSETPSLSQTHSIAPDGTLQVQTSETPALSISGSFAFGSGTPTASKAVSGTPSGSKITGAPTASRAVTGEPA